MELMHAIKSQSLLQILDTFKFRWEDNIMQVVSIGKINPRGDGFDELRPGVCVIGVYEGSRYPAIIEEMIPVSIEAKVKF